MPAIDYLPRIFAVTVRYEGASLDLTRGDRGNWTGGVVGKGELRGSKFGVSAAAYPQLDIASITVDTALAIARRDYFAPVRGPDLPPALALHVFDIAWHSGPGRAIQLLQQALGVRVDGILGPVTMTAIATAAVDGRISALCAELLARRIAFLAASPEWPSDALGFARRCAGLALATFAFLPGAPDEHVQ